jgi:tRNA(Arg) A34 adenosine deaminase TadA
MAKLRRKFDIKATIYDKKGRVLSVGENSYMKTHPYQRELANKAGRPEAIYLHAEIAALVKLKDWSRAHRIKVERYDVHGNPVIAKPCPICQSALKRANIELIEHT